MYINKRSKLTFITSKGLKNEAVIDNYTCKKKKKLSVSVLASKATNTVKPNFV